MSTAPKALSMKVREEMIGFYGSDSSVALAAQGDARDRPRPAASG